MRFRCAKFIATRYLQYAGERYVKYAEEKMQYLQYISLGVSIISLLIAGAALYFSQLRRARIKVILGPEIEIYHHDYEHGTSTGFIVPVSFLNDTPSAGNVMKSAVVLTKNGFEEERFYMQSLKFDALNEGSGKWEHEEDARPIVISARNGTHKNMWCMWHAFNQKKLFISQGKYELAFYFWVSERSRLSKITKSFYVNEEIERVFRELRDKKQTNSLKFVLEKELEFNKLMNNDEYSKLL